jgi:hypothetical protein
MDSHTLVEAALRVLVAWNDRREPRRSDLEELWAAFPALIDLPADDLACRVIHDLAGRILPGTEEADQCHRNVA